MTAPILPLADATGALVAAAQQIVGAHPHVFQSRGRLVEVFPEAGPRVVPVSRSRLRGLLELDGGCSPFVDAERPPAWLISQLLEWTPWPRLAELSGVTNVPLLRPDGTLLTRPGFDAATGVWFEPAAGLPDIPASPTRADAIAAVRVLESVADCFPLLSEAHRSAFLAALLTPFVALDGPAPLFVLDAPSHGCGPAEAADVLGVLARGRPMVRLEPTRQLRRQLARWHAPDEGLALFDGTNELDRATALATAVQDLHWHDGRRAGSRPRRVTWFARTVNCALTPASADFVLPIRFLDTVDQGQGPVHALPADLLTRLRRDRGHLVRAALTLLRAYVVAGRPAVSVAPWPTFAAWSQLIPRALVWAGREDPLVARRANDGAVDEEAGTEVRDAVVALSQILTARVGTTTDAILAALHSDDPAAPRARAALERALGPGALTVRRLGNFLRAHRGRSVEGYFLQRVGQTRSGHARWTLARNPLVRLPARLQRSHKPWDADGSAAISDGAREAPFDSPDAAVERVADYPVVVEPGTDSPSTCPASRVPREVKSATNGLSLVKLSSSVGHLSISGETPEATASVGETAEERGGGLSVEPGTDSPSTCPVASRVPREVNRATERLSLTRLSSSVGHLSISGEAPEATASVGETAEERGGGGLPSVLLTRG